MKTLIRALAILVLVPLAAYVARASVPLEEARHPLTGKWRVVSIKIGGQEWVGKRMSMWGPPENGDLLTGGEMLITPTEMQHKVYYQSPKGQPGSVDNNYTYKLIAGKPAQIDMISKESTMRGIYHLQGDTLTICTQGQKRPTDFTSPKDSERCLIVYQRVK